jgi:tripartite-type tricarboxylate transporter receptor subunit TctC
MFNFMRTRAASRPLACALAGFVATLSTAVLAQPTETISKQIIIYVAGTAGGGIDLYARFLARYFGKHIPGNPTVVVQDMPGAGGIRTANFIAQAAPRDGTAIGTFPGGPLIEPLVGARTLDYDMSKFYWIGAISRDVSVCFALGTTPFKTIDDAKAREMVIAGTGAGSETDTLPLVLNDTLGTKFKVITGYLGSKETLLAMENGEVHGRCGMTYSSLRVAKPDWLRDKMVNILVQLGRQKSNDLPNVPLISDLLSNTEDKRSARWSVVLLPCRRERLQAWSQCCGALLTIRWLIPSSLPKDRKPTRKLVRPRARTFNASSLKPTPRPRQS